MEFVGTPPPSSAPGVWAMLIVRGAFLERKGSIDLVIDARNFPGKLQFVLPPPLFPKRPAEQAEGFAIGSTRIVKRWVEQHTQMARQLYNEAKYPKAQYDLLSKAMNAVSGQSPLAMKGGRVGMIRQLPLAPKDEHAIFFRIDAPPGAKAGSVFAFDLLQRDPRTGAPQGGSRYRVVINRKPG
ncbi:MAG: hypothetical protein WKH97_00140 [Casimicrobiaceae bacterium]